MMKPKEYWDAQRRGSSRHMRLMEQGCQRCGTTARGAVCPDCFHCRRCGTGCAECIPYRRLARR